MRNFAIKVMLKNKKILPTIAVIILLAVLVFPHPARAGWLDFDIFDATFGGIVNGIVTLILNFVEQAISFFADLFDKFVQWQTNNAIYGVVVVDQSWTIIRNFVNMFFILVLIIMAFGTIFDIKNYTWREMLAPFLVSALLVNFSLTIGQYIITVANGLSNIFLKQIGSVSGTFAQGFNQVGIATSGATDLISGTGEVVVTLIFAVIFLTVVMLAFAAAAIFSLVRIFMLWFLLIISPIAWIGYSLPNLRGQTWSEWWKQFFCWCFFLPYYLFFVMFAVIFVKNRGTIPPIPGSGSTAGMTGTDFLFYALSLIFLIGGLIVARKMACASGTGIKQVFGKIEAGVRRYAPGASYVRAIGASAKTGLQAKGEQIQEKGVLGIGGAQAERLRQAKWTEKFGFGAARGVAERARLAEIEKESTKLKQELQGKPAEEQKQFLHDAQNRRGVAGEAALFEYAKQGYSTLEDYKKAMEKFGGETTALGRQYLENLKQAKLSDLFRSPDEELSIAKGEAPDTERFRELRRALFMDLAKRNRINNIQDYKDAKELLAPIPTDKKSFVDSIKPEYIFGTKEARETALLNYQTEIDDSDLAEKLVAYMSEKDKKEIANVQLREKALAVVGGENTFEGKRIINEINKFNPTINIEADLRQEVGVPIGPLSDADQNKIIDRLSEELAKKNISDIKKLSSGFYENPLAQESLLRAYEDPEMISAIIKGASPEVRRALPKLRKIADKLAADKKRAQRRPENEPEEEEPAEEEGEEEK